MEAELLDSHPDAYDELGAFAEAANVTKSFSIAEIVRVKREAAERDRLTRAQLAAEREALIAMLPAGWLEAYGGHSRDNPIDLGSEDEPKPSALDGWCPTMGKSLSEAESSNAQQIITQLPDDVTIIPVFMFARAIFVCVLLQFRALVLLQQLMRFLHCC